MTKKNHTKRALISSAISLFLCFSMLVGTTFAWFTDSVSSEKNKIVAGNLDVELEYATEFNDDGTVKTWDTVNGKSDLFDPNALWEPGHVEVVYLKVSNLGTLALKYQLRVNVFNETPGISVVDDKEFYLSRFLVFEVVEMNDPFTVYADREAAIEATEDKGMGLNNYNGDVKALDAKDGANDEDYVALIVYMPESVGNEANYRGENAPTIELGVDLFATQESAEIEKDSFGSDYDSAAPILSIPVALPENPVAGTTTTFTSSTNSEVKVEANDTFTAALKDSGVTSASLASTDPIVDSTAKKVTVPSLELVDQNGDVIDLTNNTTPVTVTIPVGDAFAEGDLVEIYHDDVIVASAKVSNNKVTYSVTHFCEVTIDASKADFGDDNLVIDSVADFIAFASLVNGGKNFAGKTVVLNADIDLENMNWTPIGTSTNSFKGTFDGQNHTVKNLAVYGYNSNVGLFGYTTDGAVKNLTVENAKVSGRLNVGVVAGTPYTSKFTNVTVTGHVEVNGMAYVGAVGGKNAYANWENITVNVDATSYVNANSIENGTAYRTYVGGVVGFNGEGGHSFKNITTNITVMGNVCDIGGAFGIAHYGNNFENITCTGNVQFIGEREAEEIGGIAGVWNNTDGTSVSFTNCKFEGTVSDKNGAIEGYDLVGGSYTDAGNGKLIVDGVEVIATVAALRTALANATGETTINLAGNIVGDVTVTQKDGVKIVINGNGYNYNGVITVDGQSARYENAALTIKNLNFEATKLSADAFIRLGHVNAARYTNNVTVQNCTFTGTGFVAVKSYTGGDWNVTLDNLTVNAGMHSLAQLKNVEKNLEVTNCTVNSKNGLNVNNSLGLTMDGCTFNVQGYAVRFGSDNNNTVENFTITNSTLNSACAEEGDAVIEIRAGAVNANYTLTNTEVVGKVAYKGVTAATNMTIDGVTAVCDGDSLKAALAAGKNVIFVNDITMTATETNAYGKTGINVLKGQTIDGNGYTLKVTNAGGTWDSAISTTGGTIKNLTVAQGFRGIFVNHNSDHSEPVVLDNVTIHGPTYTISCDQGTNQTLVATNCTINGWTSYAKTIGEAKFINCSFGKGAGYAYCRPYAPTVFEGCEFSEDFTMDKSQAEIEIK